MIGLVTGVVAGLATITPASGFVGPIGGLALGAAGAIVCFLAVDLVKQHLHIDDSLDVFAVHGVGGIVGTLLAAAFASTALGGKGYAPGMTMTSQASVQALGVIATVAWSAIASAAILYAVKAAIGLRPHPLVIEDGLDMGEHGERASPA